MSVQSKTALSIIAIVLGIVAFVTIIPGMGAWTIVDAGEVGVVTSFGAVNRVANPGVVIKIPLVEWVTPMDTRTQKDQVDAKSASKDLQTVTSTIAINYNLDGARAKDVYQNIGTNYQDKIVSPAIQDTFKSVTAQYTAEELITKREEVRSSAEKQLKDKLAVFDIVVNNFNIVNFDFSPEFNAAIEAKQVAQQSVETAKQNLEKIKVEAEQALAQAQGQADAQKALANTGSLSPEYLQYLALTKWDGKLPTYSGGTIPFVNIK